MNFFMSKNMLVHFSLGSNLGNRLDFLNKACEDLKLNFLSNYRVSSIYESEPLLKMKQPNYYNIVVCGFTQLNPFQLLEKCQQIEKKLGRVKSEKWGSRNIDLDILSYGNKIINTKNLNIPHPEIEKRSFVLLPLLEISPNWIHPKNGIGIKMIWYDWQNTNKDDLPKKLNMRINLNDYMPLK